MLLLNRIDSYEGTSRKIWGLQASWFYSLTVFLLIVFFAFFTFRALESNEKDVYNSMICSFQPWSNDVQKGFPQYCPPARNVFFLKTHKCASSTVQNILMRYGDKRNLTFALPKKTNYIGHPEKFSRAMLYKPLIQYNMLCHHLRLDENEVKSVLPPDAVFITVVRNPVNLFQSMYDYYNLTKFTGMKMEEFLTSAGAMGKLSSERPYQKFGRNQMLFDMGYDPNTWDNDSLILDAIKEMDNFFDLVLVSELFSESMILLKHKLCWGMEDITFLVHNRRKLSEGTNEKNINITSKIRQYNKADQMLYDFFVDKLQRAIDQYGRQRMVEEVKDLELWNQLWFDHCVEKITTVTDKVPDQTKAYSSKVYSFVLKNEPIAKLCKELATEELQYTNKLRLKQEKMFSNR